MTREFDPTKPAKTKGRLKVEIYSTDGEQPFSTVGAFWWPDGEYRGARWTADGRYSLDGTSEFDLVNVHVYRRWVNVYEDGSEVEYTSRKVAETASHDGRIAFFKVEHEYEEGEGL